jgi:hypothetical protein
MSRVISREHQKKKEVLKLPHTFHYLASAGRVGVQLHSFGNHATPV